MQETEVEVWKPIIGFEGKYEVSSFGRIRSLDRYIITKDNIIKRYKGKILTPVKDSHGYLDIQLGRKNHFFIHRLVGIAFIPNPKNLPFINHKDECPQNNHVSNLEWCDCTYNNSYGSRMKRITESLRQNPKVASPVLMLDKQGNIIKEYQCIVDTQNDGFDVSSVSKCCRFVKKFYSHKGYIWIYKKNINKIDEILSRYYQRDRIDYSSRKIISINIKTGEKQTFHSLTEAHKKLNISITQISRCCKGQLKKTNGYIFKYAE